MLFIEINNGENRSYDKWTAISNNSWSVSIKQDKRFQQFLDSTLNIKGIVYEEKILKNEITDGLRILSNQSMIFSTDIFEIDQIKKILQKVFYQKLKFYTLKK